MSTQIVTIIIKNSHGEFFVHQRSSTKKKFPNLYGLGAGGHIEAGETPQQAAERELQEETGLRSPLEYCFTYEYEDEVIANTIFVHETTTEEPVQPDKAEWQWSGWMTKKDIDKLLEEKKLCPDTAEFYRQYMRSHRKDNKNTSKK